MKVKRVACIDFGFETDIEAFAEACIRFSSQIALRRSECVFIEIGKSGSLYSEDSFIARMQSLLKKFELKAKVAIESNVIRSFMVARCGSTDYTQLPLSTLPYFCDPFGFSLHDEKVIHEMIAKFKRLGIKTVAEFDAVTDEELPSRFGSIARLCKERLKNSSALTWPEWKPKELIEERLEFAYDDYCDSSEPLIFKSKTGLDRLFSRLKGRGLRLSSLQIDLHLERASHVKINPRIMNMIFYTPLGSTLNVLPILREKLNREFSKSPIETLITSAHFIVKETSAGYEMQSQLYDRNEDSIEDTHAVTSHLAEVFGKQNVFQAVLQEDRVPEFSWKRSESKKEVSADLSELALRPMCCAPKPIKVQFTKERLFISPTKSVRVLSMSEIERISGHWLEKKIDRNYYYLEAENGISYWVFETPDKEHFLHGWSE